MDIATMLYPCSFLILEGLSEFSSHSVFPKVILIERVKQLVNQFFELVSHSLCSSCLIFGVNKVCFCLLSRAWKALFIERKLRCIITFFFFNFTLEHNRRSRSTEPDFCGDFALSPHTCSPTYGKCKFSWQHPAFSDAGTTPFALKLPTHTLKSGPWSCQGTYRPLTF